MLKKYDNKYSKLGKELNNLFDEKVSNRNLYKTINYLENIISTNGLEFNIYDLIKNVKNF